MAREKRGILGDDEVCVYVNGNAEIVDDVDATDVGDEVGDARVDVLVRTGDDDDDDDDDDDEAMEEEERANWRVGLDVWKAVILEFTMFCAKSRDLGEVRHILSNRGSGVQGGPSRRTAARTLGSSEADMRAGSNKGGATISARGARTLPGVRLEL